MRSGQKRGRSEGLDLSAFCQSYASTLAEAGLAESKLYSHLVSVNASEMSEDDLIASLRKINDMPEFYVYLLILGLACSGDIDVAVIKNLIATTKLKSMRKDVEHLCEAAKVDLVSAIKSHEDPAQFTLDLLKLMLANKPFEAVKLIFENTDSCYIAMLTGEKSTFNAEDHAHMYKEILGHVAMEHRGAHDLCANAAKQKNNEQSAARQHIASVLKNLNCDDDLIADFSDQLVSNQVQLSVLTGDYNARLIRSVTDVEAKRKLMQQLLDEFNQSLVDVDKPALTKRQRLALLPEENQQALIPVIEAELSPLDFLYFTLENVDDNDLVLGSIEQNKPYFLSGTDVNDCCVAVLPQFRIFVLRMLLDNCEDEAYIAAALEGLDVQLVREYLEYVSSFWIHEGVISFTKLINCTDEFSELEKEILKHLDKIDIETRIETISELYEEHGGSFTIYALSMMNRETVDRFLCSVATLFETRSRSSLKSLFKTIWMHHVGSVSRNDEKMLDKLSYLHTYEDWADAEEADSTVGYIKALNRFLAKLPEPLMISVIDGLHRVISQSHCANFIKGILKRKAFLKARYRTICSNFELTEFIDLCDRIIKPVRIVEVFNGSLDFNDIKTIEKLIKAKRLTIKAVKACVLSVYQARTAVVPAFSFSNEMNVLLILLSKYAPKEFKVIVRREFRQLVAAHGSFINAVIRFPLATRAKVIKYAPVTCPAAEIVEIFDRRRISVAYKKELFPYVKNILKKLSKKSNKHREYVEYLRAVFNANQDCFLEYCEGMTALRGVSLSVFLGFAGSLHDRLKITCALERFLTVDGFLPLITEGIVGLSIATVNELLKHVSNDELKRVLRSERCDLRLAKALYPSVEDGVMVLDKSIIYPQNAYQVGVFIGMLPVDEQIAMISQHLQLIQGKVECDFVLSRCHASVRKQVSELLGQRQQIKISETMILELGAIASLQDLVDALENMMPNRRFGLLCEWVNLNGFKVFEADRANHFSMLFDIINALPKQYQLNFALKCLPFIQHDGEAELISNCIEDFIERGEFAKKYKQACSAAPSPVKSLTGAQSRFFKSPSDGNADPESPSKKVRRGLHKGDDSDE